MANSGLQKARFCHVTAIRFRIASTPRFDARGVLLSAGYLSSRGHTNSQDGSGAAA